MDLGAFTGRGQGGPCLTDAAHRPLPMLPAMSSGLSEAQLRRTKYAAYYNELRTNRSLNNDAPFHRAIQRLGAVTSLPVLGGLHHQYCRI